MPDWSANPSCIPSDDDINFIDVMTEMYDLFEEENREKTAEERKRLDAQRKVEAYDRAMSIL